MPIVSINRFDGGIADDYVNGASGECSHSKQFDLLSYPFRLQPLRGMTNSGEPTDTELRNIILGTNGIMYGVGDNPAVANKGELYKRTGYGGSDVWTDFTTDQVTGGDMSESAGHFDFLVHFPEMGAVRKLFWACTNLIIASDPADAGSSIDTEALTFSTIGQGLVHPKDKVLYIPYQTSDATLIASITSHASDSFGTVNATAFTGLSNRYRVFCLSHFGDYLAIPMTIMGRPGEAVVGLWNRDTSITTLSQTIPWGLGALKVLNNLNGALVGVSVFSGENSGAAQDQDKIQIKVYEGGAEPFVVKEIIATRLTTTPPSCVINHRVNFIHNNRLYFSINVVNGDSDANYYGLWSVGKNKLGRWTVVQERVATNDNSETGVIAAAFYGDFLSCVHTDAGTLTYTTNGNTLASIYGATSVYETCINPDMPAGDRRKKKQLVGVYVKTLPAPASGQVVVKYRVDSNKDDSWTTVLTGTTDDENLFEANTDASGTKLKKFVDVEFRIESTGGATITELGYKYENEDSQI